MIRINFAGRLHRAYVGADGLVHWGAYNGSGDILGFKKPLGDLGVPGAGLTVAGGLAVCPEVYTDGNRLSFEARWSDGKVRQKVMSADDFRVIQEWQVIDTQPAEMAISGEPGPAGPPGEAVTEAQVRAWAADEIEKRLVNG